MEKRKITKIEIIGVIIISLSLLITLDYMKTMGLFVLLISIIYLGKYISETFKY